ncbi:putative HAD hydrolase, TIGR01457 family, partial [Planoprotostelium fungivorum]
MQRIINRPLFSGLTAARPYITPRRNLWTTVPVTEDLAKQKVSVLEKKGFILDMDGVIWHANHILPGVIDFIGWLKAENKRFMFLTNASEVSPKQLSRKMKRLTDHD